MAINDVGYITMNYGVWCKADGALIIPDDVQLVAKDSWNAGTIRVLPGRAAALTIPDTVKVDVKVQNWLFAIPTCDDLVQAGLADSPSGLVVSEINGKQSFSEFVKTMRSHTTLP